MFDLSHDKWLDTRNFFSMSEEATWPIHDRILALQASALTRLMNPTTLRRVYDNELRLPEDVDTLTLPELLGAVNTAVWTELDLDCPEGRNDRKPMISSLRRNLQREHMQRLLDLILETSNVELGEEYHATHPEAAPGPHVMLAVRDGGVGLDPKIIEQLLGLTVGSPRIYDKNPFAAYHGADVEVEGFITASKYPLADFLPHFCPLTD